MMQSGDDSASSKSVLGGLDNAHRNDMKSKGLKFCQDFLGGAWKDAAHGDIKIEPISGGTSNYLYVCSLRDNIQLLNGEPRRVIIRFYGQMTEGNHHMVLKEAVVFAMLAERNIGPNLYGIFRGGRVEEYIPSRCLRTYEIAKPDISVKIAQKMAQLHKLNMPIKKEPKWLFGNLNRWISYIYDKLWTNDEFLRTNAGLPRLKQMDLKEESIALREILDQVQSEVVFCHNDFQEGNLLQYENPLQGTDLMAIDFEYCSYNYRGFDFGNHFCEWMYDYTHHVAPYYTEVLANYPTKEQQTLYFDAYLSEMDFTGDREGLINQLIIEADVYAIASHFFWSIWSIVSAESSQLSFGYVEYSEARLKTYHLFKEQWLKNRKC